MSCVILCSFSILLHYTRADIVVARPNDIRIFHFSATHVWMSFINTAIYTYILTGNSEGRLQNVACFQDVNSCKKFNFCQTPQLETRAFLIEYMERILKLFVMIR